MSTSDLPRQRIKAAAMLYSGHVRHRALPALEKISRTIIVRDYHVEERQVLLSLPRVRFLEASPRTGL
jgi:hypothetical protein